MLITYRTFSLCLLLFLLLSLSACAPRKSDFLRSAEYTEAQLRSLERHQRVQAHLRRQKEARRTFQY